jgi:hypothetical protein
VTVEYPDKDVERLLSGNAGEVKMPTLSSIVYALDPENKPHVVAYDMQPKELFIGDLVLCHFQNGQSNNGWFHGRVAAFNVGRKTFDVLYFGGDVSYSSFFDRCKFAISHYIHHRLICIVRGRSAFGQW